MEELPITSSFVEDTNDDSVSIISNPGETSSPVPEDKVALARAERYSYSLGAVSPGKDEMYNRIISGMEDKEKSRWMTLEAASIESKRQGTIATFIQNATKEGRVLGEKDYNYLTSLSNPELNTLIANPETYFDKKYAQTVVNDATSHIIPEGADNVPMLGGLKDYITRQSGFQRILQDTNQRYTGESFLSKAVDFAKGMIPAYRWWTMTDVVENAPTSSILTGTNIAEQISYLNALPPDAAIIQAREAVTKMYEENPTQALEFANYLVSYAENDQTVNNIGMVAGTIANAAPAVGPFLRGVGLSAGTVSATIPGVLDASGQTARAAFLDVRTRVGLNARFNSGGQVGSFDEIAAEIMPIQNPQEVLRDAATTRFSREFSQRLEDLLTNQSSALLQRAKLDAMNITRIEPGTAAYQTAMTETQRLFNLQYPELNDAVLSIRPIRSVENATSNTDHIAVQIGRRDGLLFESEAQARINADLYGLDPSNYQTLPRGDKWYIEVTKAVDETLPTVRNSIQIDTHNSTTPDSIINRFMSHYDMAGRARTKDELLPTDINREVKAANFGAQQLSNLSQAIMERAFEGFPKWRRESRRNFMTFLERQRDHFDPATQERGRFSNTLGEFERDWMHEFRRLPSEQEARAYFTYRQVNDIEYMETNLRVYSGKSRLGFEQFHFRRDGVEVATPNIEGRIVDADAMFRPDDDAGILVWDRTNNLEYYRKNQLTQEDRDNMTGLFDGGYRVIQLNQYSQEQLQQTFGDLINERWVDYVVVRASDYRSSPLSLRQIPYRPGGHVNYADNFFVSQPRINRVDYRGSVIHDYFGDTTVFSARTRQEAQRLSGFLENARLLRNDGNAFDAYVRNNLPMTPQELRDMFDNGLLHWDTPIYARAKGNTTHSEYKLDQQFQNFRDPSNTPHNALNDDINLRYATERNGPMHRVVNEGTDQAPLYNLRPSRLIDPISTLARSNSLMAKGRFFDDLQIKSSERFVQEFGDLLVGDFEELQRYPLKALINAQFTNNPGSMERLAAAKNYRRAMLEFLTIKPLDNAHVDSIVNRVTQRAIETLGEARGNRAMDFVEPYLLPTVRDPVRFFRQVAFLPKMGFYNIKQLILQGGGVVHTAALEGPERAFKGMAAGYLMRPLHLAGNDAILQSAADSAVKFGWRREHFLESYRALQRSGFQNVGGEYGTLDDVLNPTIIRSGVAKAMDHSLMFFRGGEKFNRLTAWNAAYMRWRDANPLGVFNDQAAKQVLERADLLTMNMTRASNANWNQGLASIPTQFWSYHGRLMDQMLGGRLETTEKLRVMATYSAFYGVPLGVAGTTLGVFWPFHEQARKMAIESGIDINDTAWKAFLDGIPQAALHAASGGEVDPALADTFGPNGNPFLKDFFGQGVSTKSASDLLGGAAYKTISSLMSAGYGAMEPLIYATWATTDDSNTYYKTTFQDWEPLIDQISTLSQAKKAFYAATMQKYFTKNGIDVIDQSLDNKWNAFFLGVFGTNPQSVNDFFTKVDIKEDIKSAQKEQRDEAIRYLRMARDPNVSYEDALNYNKRASMHMNLGDFTETQKADIIADSAKGYMSEVEKMDEQLKRLDKTRLDRWFNSIKATQ